ncbi:MAG: histidine phosphatase family protein [Alphaproteobacteria bacterium]|nr:histidine phosphatase family protein [Alphaproteobacteria bacterium]
MTARIFQDNDQTTRWWWVRHAPVTANKGRIYGQNDMPADTDDPEIFAALARALPADAVLVTSRLRRTHQTAQAIAAAGLALAEPIVIADLNEQNFGDWQGRHYADIQKELDTDHPFWLMPAKHCAPGGESFCQVVDRVADAIARLTQAHAGRDIIAVAHGGTIRAALSVALDLDPDTALGFNLYNCSITRIDYVPPSRHYPDGSWAIVHTNGLAHGH